MFVLGYVDHKEQPCSTLPKCSHIPFSDLREWMREAEKLGELKTVLGASWEEDIGLASDVVVPQDDGPAVIFDEVPGCEKGFRILVNIFAGKRRAMTLGFPQGLSKQELSQAYFDHYQKKQQRLAPVIVDSGPVFKNSLTGEDVNVDKFPAPIWHVNDGGRYIGTGGIRSPWTRMRSGSTLAAIALWFKIESA